MKKSKSEPFEPIDDALFQTLEAEECQKLVGGTEDQQRVTSEKTYDGIWHVDTIFDVQMV